MNASIHSKTDYPFDYFFEKTAGPSSEGAKSPSEHCDHTTASDRAELDCSSTSSDSDSELDDDKVQ